MKSGLARTKAERGGIAAALLCALLALCAGVPECRAPEHRAAAVSAAHDCADDHGTQTQTVPDVMAHCMLGYSLQAKGPTTEATRVAYLLRHELLLADNAPIAAIVEPPTPPPRAG
jgi:hypothetical protein